MTCAIFNIAILLVLLCTQHDDKDKDNDDKTEIILAYTSTKGGVDTVDKLVLEYLYKRTQMKVVILPFMN